MNFVIKKRAAVIWIRVPLRCVWLGLHHDAITIVKLLEMRISGRSLRHEACDLKMTGRHL